MTRQEPSELLLSPTELCCESLRDPIGIECPQPRLSWAVPNTPRGTTQTACHIRVAGAPGSLADGQGELWDSGWVESEAPDSLYAGAPLRSLAHCCWQVRIRDGRGAISAWSEPSGWTMGIVAPDDWQARGGAARGGRGLRGRLSAPRDPLHSSRTPRHTGRLRPRLRRILH